MEVKSDKKNKYELNTIRNLSYDLEIISIADFKSELFYEIPPNLLQDNIEELIDIGIAEDIYILRDSFFKYYAREKELLEYVGEIRDKMQNIVIKIKNK